MENNTKDNLDLTGEFISKGRSWVELDENDQVVKRHPLKRFIVFAGPFYYPRGGMEDYCGSYATLEEAQATIAIIPFERVNNYGWAHIYDQAVEKIISEWTTDGHSLWVENT